MILLVSIGLEGPRVLAMTPHLRTRELCTRLERAPPHVTPAPLRQDFCWPNVGWELSPCWVGSRHRRSQKSPPPAPNTHLLENNCSVSLNYSFKINIKVIMLVE